MGYTLDFLQLRQLEIRRDQLDKVFDKFVEQNGTLLRSGIAAYFTRVGSSIYERIPDPGIGSHYIRGVKLQLGQGVFRLGVTHVTVETETVNVTLQLYSDHPASDALQDDEPLYSLTLTLGVGLDDSPISLLGQLELFEPPE